MDTYKQFADAVAGVPSTRAEASAVFESAIADPESDLSQFLSACGGDYVVLAQQAHLDMERLIKLDWLTVLRLVEWALSKAPEPRTPEWEREHAWLWSMIRLSDAW